MIQIESVTKNFRKKEGRGILGGIFFARYKQFSALNNVTFSIQKGETIGLLGPNGAGKTTLIKILAGILQPTSGKITIFGKPPEHQQHQIGLVLGPTLIYRRITGYDNLEYYGKLYGVKNLNDKISELSNLLGLHKWLDEYVEHYSEGMKMKITLARALLHDPELLILDEPTTGLDIHTTHDIHKRIRKLGKTILLTTHDVEEARILADRILILRNGILVKKINSPQTVDLKRELLNETQ